MAMSEIDSFIWKFKNLLRSGKNAHLDIKCEAGKAIVSLTAEVDVDHPQHPHHVQSRNGPSRQRRREKRAALREAAEEVAQDVDSSASDEVAEESSTENIHKEEDVIGLAAKAKEVPAEEAKEVPAEEAKKVGAGKAKLEEERNESKAEEVIDEFCSNDVYSEAKSIIPTPALNAAAPSLPASSTSSRKLAGFDYYSLKYDDSD
jgi:hypothetical protein